MFSDCPSLKYHHCWPHTLLSDTLTHTLVAWWGTASRRGSPFSSAPSISSFPHFILFLRGNNHWILCLHVLGVTTVTDNNYIDAYPPCSETYVFLTQLLNFPPSLESYFPRIQNVLLKISSYNRSSGSLDATYIFFLILEILQLFLVST